MADNETIVQLKRKKEIAGNVMSFFPPGFALLVTILSPYRYISSEHTVLFMVSFMVILLLPIPFFIHYSKAYNNAREKQFNAIVDRINNV